MNTQRKAATSQAAWDAAMRVFREAQEASDSFMPTLDSIHARWLIEQPAVDMIDWHQLHTATTWTRDKVETAHNLDVEETWQHFLNGERRWWWSKNPAQRKAMFRAALDSVLAFRERYEQARIETGIDDACDTCDALSDKLCDAQSELMDTPAPSLAALRWKLEKLLELSGDHTTSWSIKFAEQTMEDMKRLLV